MCMYVILKVFFIRKGEKHKISLVYLKKVVNGLHRDEIFIRSYFLNPKMSGFVLEGYEFSISSQFVKLLELYHILEKYLAIIIFFFFIPKIYFPF